MKILLACLASIIFARVATANAKSFLTKPDIHGNEVVFTAEGDLWLYNLKTDASARLTNDPGVENNAKFSPDGKWIAFNAMYSGKLDIYIMPAEGGIPKRLTYDPSNPSVMGWTPDGKNIIFRSQAYSLLPKLYEVPAAGGPPTVLPVPQGMFAAMSPNGYDLAYVPDSNEWMNWFRYEAGEADSIWVTDIRNQTFTELTHTKSVETQPCWVGKNIYFVSERTGVRNLWKLDPATQAVKQITFSTSLPVRYPSTDGHRVVYQIGTQLGMYDTETEETTTLNITLNSDRIHAQPVDEALAGAMESSAIGPTGTRVAIIARGQLVTVPQKTGAIHNLNVDSAQRSRNAAWSPDGKQVAFISDQTGEEQLYVVDAKGESAPKQVTKTLTGEHFRPVWSPDGKYIVLGDRTMQIQLVNVKSGEVTLVDQADRGGSYDNPNQDYTFSPDSKWIAYSKEGFGWNTGVYLYNIADQSKTEVTDPEISSGSPSFSPDGKFLYLIQQRAINYGQSAYNNKLMFTDPATVTGISLTTSEPTPFVQKDQEEGASADSSEGAPKEKKPADKADKADKDATKIDLTNIMARTFAVPIPSGNYSQLVAINGKIILANASPAPILQAYDLKAKSLQTLAEGTEPLGNADDPQVFQVSTDQKLALVKIGGGLREISLESGAPTPIPLQGFLVHINREKQWQETFNEAWRIARDFYIDPGMGGVNWNAVHDKYEKELPMVGDPTDLTRLIGDMLSELSTGHCYIGGPNPYAKAPQVIGNLGARIVFDKKAGAYQIQHILQSGLWNVEDASPLSRPGLNLKDGDYIIAINGVKLTDEESYRKQLLGTAGKVTSLTVSSSPTLTPTRDIEVVPIPSESKLVYQDWVQSRKEYVQKASHGQIAYVHVSDMEANGAKDFAQMYYANTEMPGIIVDVRYNGGGFISYNLLQDLATKTIGFFKPRYGPSWRRESWGPLGKVVGITNEWAFSDGELFSEYFKRLKIGPLVGHRTGGGEIGSGAGYPLANGSSIYVPNYGAWVPSGQWVIEGRGVEPDYPVDQDPRLVLEGQDPQLDKAIQLILDDLKKNPFKIPTPPKFPNHTGMSRDEQGVSNY